MRGVSKYFTKGVTSLFYVATLMMSVIFVIRYDAIRVALERGAFNSDATFMVSEILFIVTLSILPYVFRDSATRLLYAFNDSKTPFIVASCSIVLKFILNSIFVTRFGIYGISASTACITTFNAILLGYFAGKKTHIDYKGIFKALFKILIAGACAWCVGTFVKHIMHSFFDWSLIFGLFEIAVVGICSLITYVIASYILKIDCLQYLIERFKAKRRKPESEVLDEGYPDNA